MLRRSFVAVFLIALVWTLTVSGQGVKSKVVDINSAPESEITAVGIEKAVAKKIVEGRPYRNKRDLVSRQVLTMEQYNKVKDMIVAKQLPKE